jgi:hypothetical protein
MSNVDSQRCRATKSHPLTFIEGLSFFWQIYENCEYKSKWGGVNVIIAHICGIAFPFLLHFSPPPPLLHAPTATLPPPFLRLSFWALNQSNSITRSWLAMFPSKLDRLQKFVHAASTCMHISFLWKLHQAVLAPEETTRRLQSKLYYDDRKCSLQLALDILTYFVSRSFLLGGLLVWCAHGRPRAAP